MTENESRIVPCIWLDDQAEAAAELYTSTIGGEVSAVARYPESFDNPGHKPRGSVMTIDLAVGGQRFTLLNGGPQLRPSPSISFFLAGDDAADVTRLHDALVEGGKTLMPLDAYPWSPRYAWVEDRFGVSWQIMLGERPTPTARVLPCLMFANAQHGRAEEAMTLYTRVFPDGRVVSIDRYGEGPAEGKVVHGRFEICGQAMTAMDSHERHAFDFDDGLSLQVMCTDQAEVDHYWDALAEGGSHGPCGWLKDRFGVAWQVVPKQMAAWATHPDPVARDRAFQAMLTMQKLDVATLERALAG